ncbi:MAG: HPr family phosphocarrier protein [Bacillota bacterium]|nr:HPr family phosphocarrier protein [Bacillota bacterium]
MAPIRVAMKEDRLVTEKLCVQIPFTRVLTVQRREIVVSNPAGLHARPAAAFVEMAGRFSSSILVARKDCLFRPADARSIFSVLALGVSQGTEIVLETSGKDEVEAMNALIALLQETQ